MAQNNTSPSPQYDHWLTIATIIFLLWALLFAGVRVWAKVTRNMGWSTSDSVFTAAFVVGIGTCTCMFLATSYDFGVAHPSGVSARMVLNQDKAFYAGQILYILSIGLSRCSGALFISGLTRNKSQKRLPLVVAVVCGVWTIVCIFVIALRGNLAAPWLLLNGADSLYIRWLAIEITGMCLEVMIWSLSLILVWGLQMKFLKRFQVVGLFAVRFLIIPILAGRLYFLNPTNNSSSTFSITLSYILTMGAMHFALMSECLTCLKPFLQPFHTGYGISAGYNFTYDSNPSREIYTELSHMSQSKGGEISSSSNEAQPPSTTTTGSGNNRRRGKGEKHLDVEQGRHSRPRPDSRSPFGGNRPSVTARVEAKGTESPRRRPEEDENELLPQDRMVIQQTTTLDQIEEAAPEVRPSMYT